APAMATQAQAMPTKNSFQSVIQSIGEVAWEPSLSGPATITSLVTAQPTAISAKPPSKRAPEDWILKRRPCAASKFAAIAMPIVKPPGNGKLPGMFTSQGESAYQAGGKNV